MREGYPPGPGRRPWWLWPNLVGLDAPVVAVVWQWGLATAFAAAVPRPASVALFLTVWGVYLADRFLDADPGRPVSPGDRHEFARRHRPAVGAVAAGVFAAAAVIAALLPRAYLAVGAVVAAAAAGYFAAVHAIGRGAGPMKELLVGFVFAAGVGIPLAAERPADVGDWLPAVGGFAAVCWLNCRLIDRWEAGRPAGVGPAVAAGVAAALAAWCPPPVRGSIWAAVALLAGLHVARTHLSHRALRVLADVALLTPLAAGAVT